MKNATPDHRNGGQGLEGGTRQPQDSPNTAENQALNPDYDQANRHLVSIGATDFVFQTIDDDKTRKDPSLARVFSGTFDQCKDELTRLNQLGAGIFVTINRSQNGRRKLADITAARAVFREADEPGLPPLPLEPHLIVQTSPGKHHEYLFIDPTTDFDTWDGVMRTMVTDYGSDPHAKDRSRVLRLAGFYHQKDPSSPHMVRIVHESGAQPFSLDKVAVYIPPTRKGKEGTKTASIGTKTSKDSPGNYGKKALAGELAELSIATEGCRNDQLNKSAFNLGQLVAGGELNRQHVEVALLSVACGIGLSESEALLTISSGINSGMDQPRSGHNTPENQTAPGIAPAPRALPDELLPVAAFDYDLLPASLRDWCRDIAERMQCPPDFVAVGLMTALGSVLGRRIGIRPQAKTDWVEVANLWGLIVGRPGLLKTPALDAAMGPLNRLIAQAQNEYLWQTAEYEKTKEAEQLRAAARKKQAAKRLKGDPDADISDLQSPDLAPPTIQRYKSNDPSPAALAELLRHAPNGLMVFRDEMVSLFNSLEREDNAEGRGFYLTAWGGNSSFTSDRIGRGFNLHIPAVCVSLLGGTQPGKLGGYVRQAVGGGAADDGLLQRFGLLVWPDTNRNWQNIDRPTNRTAKNAAFETFDRLDKLDPGEVMAEQDRDFDGCPEGIPFLRFSDEALKLFVEWRTNLENHKLRGNDHPAIISHLSKYRKLIPSLALLIHLADGGKGPVDVHPTLQALAWADYLETHARRAYGAVSQPEISAAKAILRRIEKGDLTSPFKARDIYRTGWAGLTDRHVVADAVDLLVDYDWLAEEQEKTGGRPTTVYRTRLGGGEME